MEGGPGPRLFLVRAAAHADAPAYAGVVRVGPNVFARFTVKADEATRHTLAYARWPDDNWSAYFAHPLSGFEGRLDGGGV